VASQNNIFELDFSDAPPAMGGGIGFGDRVPPAWYIMRIDKVEKAETQTGKDMAVVQLRIEGGEHSGKRIVERFVFPRRGTDDSRIPLQRFHGLLVACGSNELKGTVKLQADRMVGLRCAVQVDDEEIQATPQYPARVRSRPVAFATLTAFQKMQGAAPATPAPAPEPAPVPEPAAVPAAAPEPAADNGPESSIDDLFR